MTTLTKKNAIIVFILLLVISTLINPRYLHNIHNTLLGRLLLIIFIVVASMNHIFLGLTVGLCIIIVSNMYIIEGHHLQTYDLNSNMYHDNAHRVVDGGVKKKEGVDRQTIENCVRSKDSNDLPVSKDMLCSGEDILPSESSNSKEAFHNCSTC